MYNMPFGGEDDEDDDDDDDEDEHVYICLLFRTLRGVEPHFSGILGVLLIQGCMMIVGCQWKRAQQCLPGTILEATGRHGNIYIYHLLNQLRAGKLVGCGQM